MLPLISEKQSQLVIRGWLTIKFVGVETTLIAFFHVLTFGFLLLSIVKLNLILNLHFVFGIHVSMMYACLSVLSMVDEGPWRRAKIRPYWLLCGAVIVDYGGKTRNIGRYFAIVASLKITVYIRHRVAIR